MSVISPLRQLFIRHLELRVGEVKAVQSHAHHPNLYVQSIDCGDRPPAVRQIVSGLRSHYTEEELIKTRNQVVLCNIKATKFRGILSEGMVLCAVLKNNAQPTTEIGGDKVETQKEEVMLLGVPEGAKAGDHVWLADQSDDQAPPEKPRSSFPILNLKKPMNSWHQFSESVRVDEQGRIGIKNTPWRLRTTSGWLHVDKKFAGTRIY